MRIETRTARERFHGSERLYNCGGVGG